MSSDLFLAIASFNNYLQNKKALKVNTNKAFICKYVPRTGIEPAHPCERQILSLMRLPIPPSGQIQLKIEN